MDITHATVKKKSYYVEVMGIRWSVGGQKYEHREQRTLGRLRNVPTILWPTSNIELQQMTIIHDVTVIAKWLQRGIKRDQGLLVNEPVLNSYNTPWESGIHIGVRQQFIKKDEDLATHFPDPETKLMLPREQQVFEIAVIGEPPSVQWAVQ